MSRYILTGLAGLVLILGCEKKQEDKAPAGNDQSPPTAQKADQTVEQLKGQAQTTCPVMGGKIDKKIFVDYEGKRIYFCCPGCESSFSKDPGKYIDILTKQGVVLAESPAKTEP